MCISRDKKLDKLTLLCVQCSYSKFVCGPSLQILTKSLTETRTARPVNQHTPYMHT
jgi:hypothetical protein